MQIKDVPINLRTVAMLSWFINFRHPYFLCEVTVTEDGVIRQKRLTNLATDLANRIGLRSRFVLHQSYLISIVKPNGEVDNNVFRNIFASLEITKNQDFF